PGGAGRRARAPGRRGPAPPAPAGPPGPPPRPPHRLLTVLGGDERHMPVMRHLVDHSARMLLRARHAPAPAAV
ncbi:hypothetical protein ACFV1T_26260, partial [Streptomyces vinaceus]